MKVVVATNNKSKLREFRSILGKKLNLVSMDEIDVHIDVEEDGCSFYENALKKASVVSKITGLPAIADDSGLIIEALDGAPGIYSARYAGLNADDAMNRLKVLAELENKHNRKAHFYSCIVLYLPNGEILTADGRTDGSILSFEQGKNGFGYDSVFYSDELKKSFGLATPEEKNSVSHRAKALNNLFLKLTDYIF